jgi:hypothetical protein
LKPPGVAPRSPRVSPWFSLSPLQANRAGKLSVVADELGKLQSVTADLFLPTISGFADELYSTVVSS